MKHRYHCGFAVVAMSLLVIWSRNATQKFSFATVADAQINDNALDASLQQAATNAMSGRDGAIIVMDPQTGRLRAVVNHVTAFEKAYTPGSTIKPFTALVALQTGVVGKDSRLLCRGRYSREDFTTACSHPKDLPPFNLSDAIAYSCNYYFGNLGERLGEQSLSETLMSFGFGRRTGINVDQEAAGKLIKGKRDPRNALGEGDYLETTPIQLITAYSALLNGGYLLAPQFRDAEGFRRQVRANIPIASEHRALILKGMLGAVQFGSAGRSQLSTVQLGIVGKTGTSTPAKGFRTHGWFVGFAINPATQIESSTDDPEIAVLVFLNKGHGADAARLARPIFEEYAQQVKGKDMRMGRGERKVRAAEDTDYLTSESLDLGEPLLRSRLDNSPSLSTPISRSLRGIAVHLVRENITKEISLEDYVLGVVAAEGSMEDQPEALKALAVAARTFTLKNLGRHRNEGYDFCSTTHCQRFQPARVGSDVRVVREAVRKSTQETDDLVLIDDRDQLVDSYFSASCGGMTANIQTLWGGQPQPYLSGVRDDYCATGMHHDWTDVISATQMLKALRSDPRTDTGETIQDVTIARRDATGRADLIRLDGERRRLVRGWDFKIIVGRALGWNVLKSSRFEVARFGSNFVFKGKGFGHGLGLCQEGAHVMAERGFSYRQILAKYFPGTHVGKHTAFSARARTSADLVWSNQSNPVPGDDHPRRFRASRRTLSSEHFRLNYPATVGQRDAENLLRALEANGMDLVRRLSHSGIATRFPSLEVYFNETTGDFVGRTGQPWWAAAASRAGRIELQPIELLKKRGILQTTLRHEFVHVLVDLAGKGHTPRWLAEGLAVYLAGEGPLVAPYQPRTKMTVDELERKLGSVNGADEMRAAYAAAYAAVRSLIQTEGEAGVWRRIAEGRN